MKDFVTFEIAKKLKEKGFKEQCLAYYTQDAEFYYNTSYGSDVESAFRSFNSQPNSICGKRIDAPIISQALNWLRKEKKIHIMIDIWKVDVNDTNYKWGYDIINLTTTKVIGSDTQCAYTYEQAALAGIEYTSNNLI